TATTSPSLTSRSTPLSTGTAGPCTPGYVLTSPSARSTRRSGAAADGFRRAQAHDAQRRVGRGEGAEDQREPGGEREQAGREEEELLPVAQRARVHRPAQGQGQRHPE